LEAILRALLDALIDAHAPDPELYALLDAEVPHRSTGDNSFQLRLRNTLRLAISAHRAVPETSQEVERSLFVIGHMIDAFAHGIVLGRPRHLSISAAKDEAMNAVMAYLRWRRRRAASSEHSP
jgi:hypothetical protein